MNDAPNTASISYQVISLEQQVTTLTKRCRELEKSVQDSETTINSLKFKLEIEQFKNNFYSFLIKNHTTIDLENIFYHNDGIHIKEGQESMDVFIHSVFGKKKGTVIESQEETKNEDGDIIIPVKKSKRKKPKKERERVEEEPSESIRKFTLSSKKTQGKIFRAVANKDRVDENPEEQERKIKQAEEKFKILANQYEFSTNINESKASLDEKIKKLAEIRTVKKHIREIRDIRIKLLGRLCLIEYTKLLTSHTKTISDILVKKKTEGKKLQELMAMSMTPIDRRLIYHADYFNTELDAENLDRFFVAMQINMDHPKLYVPFSVITVCEKIQNYSLALFSLKKLLRTVLVNPYGCANIIYLHRKEKDDKDTDDPYLFYILEKITNGNRDWKMECRLYDLSKIIAMTLRSFCIRLFRKIYFDIFRDNIYRSDYYNQAPATSTDCEQLMQNIVLLSKQKTFCETLREIIKDNNSLTPTIQDKVNLQSDDGNLRRTFHSEEDNKTDIYHSIQAVFDGISTEDMEAVATLYETM